VNHKTAGKWMFIPLKMVLIGIDPWPHTKTATGATKNGIFHTARDDRRKWWL
jgi:hypothetical protein